MGDFLTFRRVFGVGVFLFLLSLIALATARHEWAWGVGYLYLAYDSVLLSLLIWWSRGIINHTQPKESAKSHPSITVLVPARNEKPILPACLDALLAQDDQPEEIRIIDDGSQDGTRAMLEERYQLQLTGEHGRSTRHPHLFLWSKPSTGKARSFNQILPECRNDLIVTIDADTVIAPGSIRAIREAFAADETLAAGCGILAPQCRPGRFAGYFEFFQRFEYMRAFLWRLAWSRWNALVLVSGAFAVYRRDVMEELGGFDGKSWVEDYEILYRLHRRSGDQGKNWTVRVIPEARGVTDAPNAPGQFLRQRSRWFGGFLATLFGNRDMVGNGQFGGMGRRLLPAKTVDTLLPLFTSLAQISLIGLIIHGGFLSLFVLMVLAIKLLFDLFMHLWAIRLFNRWLGLPFRPAQTAASMAATILEPFFFQPLRYSGALLGWIAFLRNRFSWESQRLAVSPLRTEEGKS